MSTAEWTQKALNDVVERWIVGSTPPRSDTACFVQEGGTPWAKAEDVKGGTLLRTAEQLSGEGGRGMKLIQPESVLLTTCGTIGSAAVAGRPMYCNQDVQALSFRRDEVLPWFGYYYLRCRRPTLLRLAHEVTIPYVSKKKLQRMKIAYPPIPVQERIIRHMRLAESLCEQAARLRELPERFLRAAAMRDAGRAVSYVPMGEMLEEPALSGLRAKASDTGEGIALVSGFGGAWGRLGPLTDCPRVQVSPEQSNRYRLHPGDILLRSSEAESGSRAVLVDGLSAPALVGGSLIRLRPKAQYSPAWLLAWLTGPAGDRLFLGGRLQKRALAQFRVPLVRDPEGFERMFAVCVELAEQADQFSGKAQALFEAVLHRTFAGTGGEAFYEVVSGGQEADFSGLTQAMRDFLGQMSRFQQELYRTLLKSGGGEPVHVLLKQMRSGSRRRADGIQDALSAMALLEQFGFAERESPRKIPRQSGVMESLEDESSYIMDHNGQPICIDTYKPVEDLGEENQYAAGTGEDTKL